MMRISWTLRGRLQYILARGLLQKKKKNFFVKNKIFQKKKSFVNNFLRSEIFKKKKKRKSFQNKNDKINF